MERTNNPRYGTCCFTNCPESTEAYQFKYTKRLYENRENISVNFVTFVKNWYFNDKLSVAAHLCRNVSGSRTFRIVTTL